MASPSAPAPAKPALSGDDEDDGWTVRSRFLVDPAAVLDHNAWDDVEWQPEQLERAQNIVKQQHEAARNQSSNDVDAGAWGGASDAPATHAAAQRSAQNRDLRDSSCDGAGRWDTFYLQHDDGFFKDRQWLFKEFPLLQIAMEETTLANATAASSGNGGAAKAVEILEVGCGAGNTIYPLLSSCTALKVHACDFAPTAVDVVKAHPMYNETGRVHAFVCDIAADVGKSGCGLLNGSPEEEHELLGLQGIQPGSLDFVITIFVLSAIDPHRFPLVMRRLASVLKPGGCLLFRDYGLYDLTQLRFKPGRVLGYPNQYVRGDGTKVYYFNKEELKHGRQAENCCQSGLPPVQNRSALSFW